MNLSEGLENLGSNSNAERGTADVGYEEHGPYHCEDCVHKTAKDEPYCIHPKVVGAKSMRKRLAQLNGRMVVKINLARGCCRFVNQPLEHVRDEDEQSEYSE